MQDESAGETIVRPHLRSLPGITSYRMLYFASRHHTNAIVTMSFQIPPDTEFVP